MFRTVMALVIALVVAIVIGAFQILGLDIATLQAVLSGGDIVGFGVALAGLWADTFDGKKE